ncbi:MAG: GtrA family protein [Dysgonamonadaceae bacterium]|jgi:putative flippase GtrA|nr:GtrA family protein [Dysgonamonadaceae bacterium]
MSKTFIIQTIKYGLVGIVNTSVTLVVIWLVLRFLFGVWGDERASDVAFSISNALGYGAGFLTSFLLNRKWTFKSHNRWLTEFVKFVTGAMICYIPQLILVTVLNRTQCIPSISFSPFGYKFMLTSPMLCNTIGIVFYTVLNFMYNKYYTFKK